MCSISNGEQYLVKFRVHYIILIVSIILRNSYEQSKSVKNLHLSPFS
jgi:hypothetical protein